MRNIVLIIAYDGTPFLGWQKTAYGPSIEGALEEALWKILEHPVSLQAASRTDAGVHASFQAVNFFTPATRYTLDRLQKSLQGLLPKEITVLDAFEKPCDFHPTLSAQGKIYKYTISTGTYQIPFLRNYAWHYPYPIDLSLMEKGAHALLGSHDFSGFCNDKKAMLKNPICCLQSIEIEKKEQELFLYISGDRFLYKMVRNIVGTLAYIGSSRLPLQAIQEILDKKDRTLGGITAPAKGLTLYHIAY